MAKEKKPFHEAVSYRLMTAPVGISTDLRDAKAAEVMAYLTILSDSKMPATAAHQLAKDHEALPGLLNQAGQAMLAEFAAEVLVDLRGREDDPTLSTVALA